ncbi:glycosyltransferase, partial [Sphingomonas sp.]|uniref:glycosyltransferase n=1 Tax=Sphingomonas sp. TaxID=28214 RepID=UPI0025DF09FA
MNAQAKIQSTRPAVIVFTPVLLPYSETFIRSHVEAFRRYRPVLTGLRRTDGLDLRGLETATIAASTRERLLLYWLGRSAQLDRLVDTQGVKLVHCHFADAGGLLAAYCRRRKIPLIVTIHGSDILRDRRTTLGSWLRHRLFRLARDTAALFLPVSNWLRGEAIKLIPADKCVRHYLGIPLQPRRSGRRPDGVVTILFVGRLVAKKGVPYLIEAVRELVSRNYEFQVRIVGDGPLSAGARDAASADNLPITFTGALPPDHVLAEMDEADIFCLPSTQAP